MKEQKKNFEDQKEKFWNILVKDGVSQSPSHDKNHIDLVFKYSWFLHTLYGGDMNIITPAVVFHDLGRVNSKIHGKDSINLSIKLAEKYLKSYRGTDKEKIIKVISEHDHPEVTPSTIESKILKEADFLAGFGAWGILRTSMWTAEGGQGIDQVFNRLFNKMPKRLQSLEFPESKVFGKKKTIFTKLFKSELENCELNKCYNGKYIIFEGISGSGKNKQAELLENRLKNLDYDVITVNEPNEHYQEFKNLVDEKRIKPKDYESLRFYLLLADRKKLIEETVIPALQKGKIVLSVRSFISFLVYQCGDLLDTYSEHNFFEWAYHHNYVPFPDIVILYDLPPELADSRIEKRGLKRGFTENINNLIQHREKYKEIVETELFSIEYQIIDSSTTIEEVNDATLDFVLKYLEG